MDVELFNIDLSDYKAKIQELRKELSGLEKGTEEFMQVEKELNGVTQDLANAIGGANPSMNELRAVMKQLRADWASANDEAERGAIAQQMGVVEAQMKSMNQELKNTSQGAMAAEGSYNALVVKMRELQEAAKATGDAAERSNYAQQANAVNEQLKAMDAEMGNYKRNVGSYENAISNSFQQIGQSLTPLLGSTSKMAGALGKFGGSVGIATGSLGAFIKAFKALKIAMASNPIGLVATLIVGLTVGIVNHIKAVKQAEEEYKQWKKSLTDISESMNEYIAKDKAHAEALYQTALRAKMGTDERKKAVQELQKEYPAYFGNLNAELATNKQLSASYLKLAEDIVKAAKARAAEDKLVDIYKQQLDLQMEVGKVYADNYKHNKTRRKDEEEALKYTKLETDAYRQRHKIGEKTAELRKSEKFLTKQIANNQVDIHAKVEDTAVASAKQTKQLDKQKDLLEQIEAKYKKIYELYDLMIAESDVYAESEWDKNLEKWLITQTKLKKGEDEIMEKYEAGLITAEEYNKLIRQNAVEWKQAEREFNNYIKEFKGETAKGELQGLLPEKEDNKIFNDVMKDVRDRIDETTEATLRLYMALEDVSMVDIFSNPERSLSALSSIMKGFEQMGKQIPQSLKTKTTMATIAAVSNEIANLADSVTSYWKETVQAQVDAGEITQEEAEKQFESIKAVEIATAIMQTLSGALAAQMSVWTEPSIPLWGKIAMSALLGMETLMSGYAQVDKIRNTSIGGGASKPSITVANATPLLNEAEDVNQLNAMEVTNGAGSQRVYILESDIQKSNTRVEVRESQSKF